MIELINKTGAHYSMYSKYSESKTEEEKRIEELKRRALVKSKYDHKSCMFTNRLECNVHTCAIAKCSRVSEYTGNDYFKTFDSNQVSPTQSLGSVKSTEPKIRSMKSTSNTSIKSSKTIKSTKSSTSTNKYTSGYTSGYASSILDDTMRNELKNISNNKSNNNKSNNDKKTN